MSHLIATARSWTWTSDLEDKAKEWLARQVVGYCEEVFGLVRSLESGADYPAAVVRSVFAIWCANLIAVRHGVLYESEKHLWSLVADRQGPEWRKAQEAAFALQGEPLGASARAGLRLYKMVADEAWANLTDVQRVVVDHALQELDRVVRSSSDP